jgi:hypothetical protein
MSGNKKNNGVHEVGTTEITAAYKGDTPGQTVDEYLKLAAAKNVEKKKERSKNFSQVFDNPLKGFPYNEDFTVRDVNEEVEAFMEGMDFWKVTVTKNINKLKKGRSVIVKARNSAEALTKGAKNMGDPMANQSGYLDAVKDKKEEVEEGSSTGQLMAKDLIKGMSYQKIAKKYGPDARAILMAKDLLKGMSDQNVAKKYRADVKLVKQAGELLKKISKEEVDLDESDLGLSYKKGKTVQVTHKTSGKELIIIDKPSVRKEYEKIGYYAEEVGLDEAPKYDLYHKDFSTAMQYAYKMAKKLHGITIDPKEIDDKVATGPRKP